ncbi:hypothetical protein L195_g024983 [Trifolium pratense]|uniref:Uncharacterized protein n=1 Tax=Trifolium pratense TaxID=57577 RepID=A0A2K3NF73_TRIPR|nr:hypothetical protein L195_g024983 [Trifolium pratense]
MVRFRDGVRGPVGGSSLCERFRRLFDLSENKLGSVAEAQSSDRWLWLHDPDHSYFVRGAYQLLTSQDSVTLDAVTILYGTNSSLLQQVVLEHAGLFYSSFGLLAFGLCGRKEIIEYSEAQQVLLINCWIRSSCFPICG